MLYNTTTHKIQGIWEAISSGQANIDATAWKSQYPNQVRVRQRSQQIQSVPKDLIKGIATGERNKVFFRLEGEKAQSLLKFFSSDDENEALPGIPLIQEELDFRNKYPARFLCTDGHRVRSLSEKAIDDWLASRHIFHSYEPLEYFSDVAEQLIPDFRIHDKSGSSVYVEFWGKENEPEYRQRMERKKSIYGKYQKSLIELTFRDLETLDAVMHKNFRVFDIFVKELK